MTDNKDTFDRQPYTSGNSKVITVSGITGLNDVEKVFIKSVRMGDVQCTLFIPYTEMSQLEVEEMEDEIDVVGGSHMEKVGNTKTPEGAKMLIDDEMEDSESDSKFVVFKRQ